MGPASPPDWASTVNGPRERGSFVPLPRQVSVIGWLNTVACCTTITAMSRSTKSSPAIRLVRRRYCCRMRVRHAAQTLRIHPTLAIFLPPKHLKSRRFPPSGSNSFSISSISTSDIIWSSNKRNHSQDRNETKDSGEFLTLTLIFFVLTRDTPPNVTPLFYHTYIHPSPYIQYLPPLYCFRA